MERKQEIQNWKDKTYQCEICKIYIQQVQFI